MAERCFSPALFAFLRELSENNERSWFKANQDRYDRDVRQPALDFIEELAAPLYKVSPHFSADPRPLGGSLFRIHRDARFTKDKTPYKTHVGMQFRHVAATDDVHAPGFYLHLEPGNCLAAVGLWHPATPHAQAIRRSIVDRPAAWKKATRQAPFSRVYALGDGDLLQRVPGGLPADHPLAEDLRRRDFTASTRLTQAQVTASGFLQDYSRLLAASAPFMRFLCEALDLAF